MKNYDEYLEKLSRHLDDKQYKKYKIDILKRLFKKLEDQLDDEIIALEKEVVNHLEDLIADKGHLRSYKRSIQMLKKRARDQFGYVAKNELKEQYMALGIALGVAFGTAFVSINPAFIGIGLPIGLAVGLAIGDSKERKAQKEDKIY